VHCVNDNMLIIWPRSRPGFGCH